MEGDRLRVFGIVMALAEFEFERLEAHRLLVREHKQRQQPDHARDRQRELDAIEATGQRQVFLAQFEANGSTHAAKRVADCNCQHWRQGRSFVVIEVVRQVVQNIQRLRPDAEYGLKHLSDARTLRSLARHPHRPHANGEAGRSQEAGQLTGESLQELRMYRVDVFVGDDLR